MLVGRRCWSCGHSGDGGGARAWVDKKADCRRFETDDVEGDDEADRFGGGAGTMQRIVLFLWFFRCC